MLGLQLEPAYSGLPTTFTATGATSGMTVGFIAGETHRNDAHCPAQLGGLCIDIANPTIIGTAVADGAGVATLTVTVPTTVQTGITMWFQAALADGPDSQVSYASLGVVYDADCPDTIDDFWAESDAIRSCNLDTDCGQVLTGTSCGCTRDWVARNGVDTTVFYDLLSEAGQCGLGLMSTCDCPPTNGFLCDAGMCTWNY